MTNEELEKLLFKKAQESGEHLESCRDLILSKTFMTIAEHELVDTFDEKQLSLYQKFCEQREIFYANAKKHYHRNSKKAIRSTKKD